MILRPGDLFHLAPGFPDAEMDVAGLRYALLLVAVLWSLLRGRGHPRLALAAGVAFVLLAVGFWALGLGRPYGLFLDARITRCAGTRR